MVEGTTITGVLTTVGMAAVLVAAVSPSAMVRVHSIHMQWCVIIQFTYPIVGIQTTEWCVIISHTVWIQSGYILIWIQSGEILI